MCSGAGAVVEAGTMERRLLNDLLQFYNNLERPVYSEQEPVLLKLGLTLQQIIDVVSTKVLSTLPSSTRIPSLWPMLVDRSTNSTHKNMALIK